VYRNNHENADDFNMRNIKGKKIAYMASRPITDTLTKAGAVLEVVRDLPKALKDLSAGEYDAVICFRYQAKYHIKNLNLENLTAEDLTLTPREYCYVSHNRELINAIDRELLRMEEDGTINDIYGDYISQLDSFQIPQWVWWLISAIITITLLLLLIMQRRHSKRLHVEMLRAKKSEHMMTVFLANVSHALRTPLNAIIGFSEMLSQAGKDDIPFEDQHQMFNQINTNGHQLLYFINELLELSNIEGG
jgi:signal transduction histidine kinase